MDVGGGGEVCAWYEAEFLDEIQTKVLGVFILVILIHLYSFGLRFLFHSHTTSYSFPKGERKPYRNLKSENSQGYAQKPQLNYTFMNSASGKPEPKFVNV